MSPLGPLAGFNFMVHPIWSQLGYFKPSHPRSLASLKLLDIGEGCTEMYPQCLRAKDRPQNFLCTPSFCKAPQAALQDPFPAVGPGPPLTGCRWPGLWTFTKYLSWDLTRAIWVQTYPFNQPLLSSGSEIEQQTELLSLGALP